MASKSQTLNRRAVLGAMMVTTIFPPLARGQQGNDPAKQEPSKVKISMTFNGQTMIATLYDNASARDFASLLPLELKIEDYSTNEKIANLPRKLTEAGSGPFQNERPGDLCYFAPWGNLALFHGGYRYSSGLIRLGRFDDGFEPLLMRGAFRLRIERV
ncbi:cyclophilin-like fold protein [Rhizobium sp. CCGE 510]|uniref:cyclophilin-like fold protein n=1 Tax=Rhizobium sp. CCGE 510 TaxID=1132836 RepID=UPI00027B833C|nr:cyclophilin-like fold protein [Rhizobium sp. CCGE 510]EJT06770.1 hypothetical protein RCCGE510_03213 [Rhizobium sp. CCGE 510]